MLPITFKWRDYGVTVSSIDDDDGFLFSAIDYEGKEWNELIGSKEEYQLYNFTIEKLEQMNGP